MKVTMGEAGLDKSWQAPFPRTVKCCRCRGEARIGFVAHKGINIDDMDFGKSLNRLHPNEEEGGRWPHDFVAVCFCRKCLETTAQYNQA